MALVVTLFIALILSWQAVSLTGATGHEAPRHPQGESEARNFIVYHRALAAYLLEHPKDNGQVDVRDLPAPTGSSFRPQWAHEVVDGELYTFTQGWTATPGFNGSLEALGEHTVCQRHHQELVMRCARGQRLLPIKVAQRAGDGVVLVGR